MAQPLLVGLLVLFSTSTLIEKADSQPNILDGPLIGNLLNLMGQDQYLISVLNQNPWIVPLGLKATGNQQLMQFITALPSLASDPGFQELIAVFEKHGGASIIAILQAPQDFVFKVALGGNVTLFIADVFKAVHKQPLPGVSVKVKQGLVLVELLARDPAIQEILAEAINRVLPLVTGGGSVDATAVILDTVESVAQNVNMSSLGITDDMSRLLYRALRAIKDPRLLAVFNNVTEVVQNPPTDIRGWSTVIKRFLHPDVVALARLAGIPEELLTALNQLPPLLEDDKALETTYNLYMYASDRLVAFTAAAASVSNTYSELSSDTPQLSLGGLPQTVMQLVNSVTNIDLAGLVPGVMHMLLQNGVSAECSRDLMRTAQGVINTQDWAVNMLDAWGKPRSSIFRGHAAFPGNYNQCKRVREQSNVTSASQKITGSYCKLYVTVPPNLAAGLGPLGSALQSVLLGLCTPATCTQNDVQAISNQLGQALGTPIWANCGKPGNFREDKKAVITAGVFISIAFFIIMLSVVDWLVISGLKFEKAPKKPVSNGVSHEEDGQGLTPRRVTIVLPQEYGPSVWIRLIQAVSLYSNVPRLFNTSRVSGSLDCLNGLRFLSMAYVLLGHTYVLIAGFGNVIANPVDVFERRVTWDMHLILAGTYAVDSFFLMSGLLVTYLLVKKMLSLKENGKNRAKNFLLGLPYHYYLHRLLRLTPLYAFFIFFSSYLWEYMGEGPFWAPNIGYGCRKNWWHNLLYINNFMQKTEAEMCIGWSWYLANDMQFYVIAPIFIAALLFVPVLGFLLLTIAIISSVVANGVLGHFHWNESIRAVPFQGIDFFEVYVKPYTRFHVYGIGMLCGYLVAKHKKSLKMHWVVACGGWLISTALGLLIVFVTIRRDCEDCNWSREVFIIWESLHRPLFGLCLAWVIVACCTGRGGVVNNLLSWKGFLPLSRLTYAGYLLHEFVMFTFVFGSKDTIYFMKFTEVELFFGFLVLTYFFGAWCSLLFEVPAVQIEKVLVKALPRMIKRSS